MSNGLARNELDIGGCGILKDHAMPHGFLHNCECEKRRIFQLFKTPFVGIGNKRDLFRQNGLVPFGRSGDILFDLFVRNNLFPASSRCSYKPDDLK